jgi:phosphatidylserine synthase
MVGEGLSATWLVAGVAMAGSSPSMRAAELTVAGVATGIMAYLSQDRRRAGWVSGVLLTVASWIRLADTDLQAVEWYTLPAAAALLVYGTRRLRSDSGESSWRCLGPGLSLALVPSLLVAVSDPVSWRGLVVGLASAGLVALGVKVRLAAPFALGALATAVLALREIWPVAAFIPRWTLLFLIGGLLLVMGMTWEARVNDVRAARRYVRGLR